MFKIIQRPLCYLAELGFCLRVGCGLRAKLALMAETLTFHLKHNRLGGRIQAQVRIGSLRPHLMMRTYGGDIFIFHEVLKEKVYQINASRLSAPPQVIVDLGANIGLTTLLLAAQFPEARFICVEPHPENVELLRHNLRCLGDRAQIIHAGIADKPGTMQLSLAAEHYNASLVRGGDEGIEVRTITMDDLFREAGIDRIDLLKMDIEGAEALILPGRPRWLCEVDVLLAELHGKDQDKLVGYILDAGFQIDLEGSQVSAWRVKTNPS
jgi:FkbM family methyltransferase